MWSIVDIESLPAGRQGEKDMSNHKLNCCETCQIYWTCETKWYRGERGDENICCPVCNYFKICLDKSRKGKEVKDAK